MKKALIILLSVLIVTPVSAQKLLDVYKSGKVVLTPDTEYAKNNDWNEVFKTYYDTIYNKPMGERKSLKLMPDGSVVVNHQYKGFYSKFSPNGVFEKEINIKSTRGVQKKYKFKIAGIVNGNTLYTDLDNLGNMLCLDFEGNFKKKLVLDYMVKQVITLPNNKIAVVGWVMWKEKFRNFVEIVNLETNEQNTIWEFFTQRDDDYLTSKKRVPFEYAHKSSNGGGYRCSTMPFAKRPGFIPPPQIATLDQKIIIAIPSTGEILIYDLSGKLIDKDRITWTTNYVSAEEQKEIQQKAIDKYKETIKTADPGLKEALEYMIPMMEMDLKNISQPIPKPYFSTILKDSDDNLLFFEYPKEEGKNKFNVWVYQDDGEFICQSSFQCEDYNLQIKSSKMVFHNGYIYSLQTLKEVDGVPLRLVRFKVESE